MQWIFGYCFENKYFSKPTVVAPSIDNLFFFRENEKAIIKVDGKIVSEGKKADTIHLEANSPLAVRNKGGVDKKRIANDLASFKLVSKDKVVKELVISNGNQK